MNELSYKSIEGAATFCKLRGNPHLELAHWLAQIFQLQDSDMHKAIAHFGADFGKISTGLTNALNRLPRGASGIGGLADSLRETAEQGWVYCSLQFGASKVRSGHLLLALLKTPSLENYLLGVSAEFGKIKPDVLRDKFDEVTAGSPEETMTEDAGGGAAPGEASGAIPAAGAGKQEALGKYSIDLTEKARKGEIDPIFGRDDEIRQIVDILMRRRQNNPILTGEAGVGKTAVVEGFAIRLVQGDVPPALRGVSLRTLDMGLLQAGASMKGEFENRLKQVIEEVQGSPTPIILFIDEAHTLIGAGGSAGQNDAANLLKPALARGTLRTIAATTWAEYKKYFEKDPALTRRFQVVKVEEPDEAKAITMIRGLAKPLMQHHKVHITSEAVEAAVKLSHRYIPARQLPDKAVSLMDTACARVAISQHATPATLEDCQRRIQALKVEQEILDWEANAGAQNGEKRATVQESLAAAEAEQAELNVAWEKERTVVKAILELKEALQKATAEERPAKLKTLLEQEAELDRLQGESPLILPAVNEAAVASVVADWTGIPVGRMVKDEIAAVLSLADNLEKRVVGQRHALEAIAKRIETSRAGLTDPRKPIGVFMLAGTSGVGKTETALALAETLYGGEGNMITINMSEFQEAHTVSTLKGAPPGYVGYGEGGVLTEAVRRRPYSVVLLDEVEKAHTDVHEMFFQVFDKGLMEDGEGREIDFKNTVILLTTNAGTDTIAKLCKDPDLIPDVEGMGKALRDPLLKIFPPALLGRLVVIPYYPLADDVLKRIIRLQLGRVAKRTRENRGVEFVYGDDVVNLIAARCTEVESGGRMVDAILTQTLLPEISRELLKRMMENAAVSRIEVRAEEGKFSYTFV